MDMLARGEITAVNNAGLRQTIQATGFADELLDNVERFQPYGLFSVPVPGSETLLLFVGGQRDHAISTVVDDPALKSVANVLALTPGEVAIVGAGGASVTLRANGTVQITGNTVITGNLAVTGTVADGVGTMGAMRSTYNSHTHGGAGAIPQMT